MSNILIIKHGSLGDIAQASGAIQDIFEHHKGSKIHILTTKPYFELFKKNPHISNVILDKRLSKLNLIYLYSLMKSIKKYNFAKVYDLQNSSRTSFYKRILFPKASKDIWSSTETTLPDGKSKNDFDKDSVLDRFDYQLKSSGISTIYTIKPDFKWSSSDISQIKDYYDLNKYIVLFPFCSPHLTSKIWPYYNELINMVNEKFNNEYKLVLAPAPNEIKEANYYLHFGALLWGFFWKNSLLQFEYSGRLFYVFIFLVSIFSICDLLNKKNHIIILISSVIILMCFDIFLFKGYQEVLIFSFLIYVSKNIYHYILSQKKLFLIICFLSLNFLPWIKNEGYLYPIIFSLSFSE